MKFQMRLAAWFGFSLAALIGLLMLTAHWHLDEELRRDRWDRSHPGYPNWVIHGSFTNEEVHDILGELTKVWLWVGIPAVVISLGIGALLARRSIRPIHSINRELSLLEARSLRKGITVPENDAELSDLVRHINLLLERVGNAYQNLDEFSSKVSHEIRTPLTLIRMKIERNAAALPPELSEELQDELARLSRLVDRSLLAAKAESGQVMPEFTRVDVTGLLEDIRDGYALLAQERGLDFQWMVEADLAAVTDAGLLRQILHNLLGNAVRYARTKVRVRAYALRGALVVATSNDFDSKTMAEPGIGLGVRLVRRLSSTLGIRFRQRSNSGIFAFRLQFPDMRQHGTTP
jgi:signal transduction histidine kinase